MTATVDLDEVISYRAAVSSLQEQASSAPRVPTIAVDFNLCVPNEATTSPNAPIEARYHEPEEEIALGPFHAQYGTFQQAFLMTQIYTKCKIRFHSGHLQALHVGCGTT